MASTKIEEICTEAELVTPWVYGQTIERAYLANPPWYVIRLSHPKIWPTGWFWWQAYLGPPVVFLTRQAARKKAKALQLQYHCKVEVLQLIPAKPDVRGATIFGDGPKRRA